MHVCTERTLHVVTVDMYLPRLVCSHLLRPLAGFHKSHDRSQQRCTAVLSTTKQTQQH